MSTMDPFHRILAVLLAIFVASPLCCCADSWQMDSKAAEHSCCGGGEKEKQETACNCPADSPQATENDATIVKDQAELPPLPLGIPISIPVPLCPSQVSQCPIEVDKGPPGTLLVVLQRFLI